MVGNRNMLVEVMIQITRFQWGLSSYGNPSFCLECFSGYVGYGTDRFMLWVKHPEEDAPRGYGINQHSYEFLEELWQRVLRDLC